MQGLEFLKLLKNVKKFLEEVYSSHVQVIIVHDQMVELQPGDVILRPTKDEYLQILRRLKFKKSLERLKKEKEGMFGYADSRRGFRGYS